MKVVVLVFVLLIAAPSFAQNPPMPDRAADIARIVQAKYVQMLNGDDDRRVQVLDLLCGDLNLIDAGRWARLIKNDRNPPGQPADTLVWIPTREHVDALADFGPAWIPRGVLPTPAWAPLPCATNMPPVDPDPGSGGSGGTVPLPPGTGAGIIIDPEIIRRLAVIENKQDQALVAIDDAKTTIVDVLKGFGKWVSGPLGTAIITYLLTRPDEAPK